MRTTGTLRRPMGRPRRLELDAILKAAAQLPAEDLSMLGLARHMRVPLSTLYHYVRSREQLLDLLGRDVLAALELPPDTLHWADWLLQYASALRALLLRFRGRISYLNPTKPGTPTGLEHVETALRVLTHGGFSSREAITAMRMVVNEVFGFVQWEVACREETRPGGGQWARFYQALGAHGPDGFPLIRSMMFTEPPHDEEFDAIVRTVLAGIGLWRGKDLPAHAPRDKALARPVAVGRVPSRNQRRSGARARSSGKKRRE
ncbi:MAG: regulatory protein TetR [Deltaproteobacteria bacterium]|nr:regulatory protein TetR [Deltaproteobacteria bacterium]